MIRVNLLPQSAEPTPRAPNRDLRWTVIWMVLVALSVLIWFVRGELRIADLRAQAAIQRRYQPLARVSHYGELMLALARALPEDDIWLLQLDESSGVLSLRGCARVVANIDRYSDQLQEEREFASSRVQSIQKEANGSSSFLLEILLGEPVGAAAKSRAQQHG